MLRLLSPPLIGGRERLLQPVLDVFFPSILLLFSCLYSKICREIVIFPRVNSVKTRKYINTTLLYILIRRQPERDNMQDKTQPEDIDNPYSLIAHLVEQLMEEKQGEKPKEPETTSDSEESQSETEEDKDLEKISELEDRIEGLQEKVENMPEKKVEPETEDEEKEESSGSSEQSKGEVRYQCKKCGETYEKANHLAGHLYSVHNVSGEGATSRHGKRVRGSGGESVEVEESEETGESSESKSSFECKYCGSEYDSKNGLSMHVASLEDHKNTSELFRDGESYNCPECGKTLESAKKLSDHLRSAHDGLLVDYAIKRTEESGDGVEESVEVVEKDEIAEYNVQELEDAVKAHLDRSGVAKTASQIIEGLTGQELSSTHKDYKRVYRILKEADGLKVSDKFGRETAFYTDEAQKENKELDSVIEQAKNSVGGHNYKLFSRAMQKLLPKRGETKTLGFYDFTGEFVGDDEMTAEDMWANMVAGDQTLVESLRKSVEGEMEVTVNPEGGSKPKAWEITFKR